MIRAAATLDVPRRPAVEARWRQATDGARSVSPDRPILVIHGFLSSPRVMRPLATCLEQRHGRRVIAVGISPGFDDLRSCARAVAEQLDALAREPGFAYADIVAHSMGGLVATHLLKALDSGRQIRRVVTLGTPHRGTPLATLAAKVLGRMCLALPQMRPDSGFVADLRARSVPCGSQLISVFGSADRVVAAPWSLVDKGPGQRNCQLAGLDHLRLLLARSARRCVSDLLADAHDGAAIATAA